MPVAVNLLRPPGIIRNPGKTGHAEVTAFVRRVYGDAGLARVYPWEDVAITIVAADPAPRARFTDLVRQVVVRDDKLWLVREVRAVEDAIYLVAAMRQFGFKTPEIKLYHRGEQTYIFQELLIRGYSPFLSHELAELAPLALPAVLAASAQNELLLNLNLKKFITFGRDLYFIGLRPRPMPFYYKQIAYDLLALETDSAVTSFSIEPTDIVILEGKFFCRQEWWKNLPVPMFTLLLHTPQDVAETRLQGRVHPAMSREQSILLRACYDPSYFEYVWEENSLDQLDALHDSSTGKFYALHS